ncbi:Spy/CpxP family protein refolding chaperone [Pseudorhodoplanes sp.]|uniref:Spy/CpxP family protein refolding chaperone n=1 Tax=Pseudorhodoplanes sp. TaxID=1934341 RepID=UPI002BE09E04|nr:Spy/CpxP family protein refolding chaperone [Pseudorhodoplanes sp.]HWV52291.1 Spy/CpxP family protein refolding chaperone [Pseudorhodoplanes sp.]
MTEHKPSLRSDDPIETRALITQPPVPRTRRGRLFMFASIVAATAILTGAVVNKALSNPFGGWHGARAHFGAPLDPAQIEDRADRMVRHLSIELDATNEQQEKLRGIMRDMLKDVLPARDLARSARQQARDLLTATTIDRAAMEKLRADQIALADSVSKRVTQALGDAAEVLSPEQRRKLADRFPPHGPGMGMMPGWRRG